MSYMFWKRAKKESRASEFKFRAVDRVAVAEPTPQVQVFQETIPIEPVEEPQPVEVVEEPRHPTIVQNLFVRLKRDRLMKILLALLIGILLLPLFLAIFGSLFGSNDGIIGMPSPFNPGGTQVPIPKQAIIGDNRLILRVAVTNDEHLSGLRFTPTLAPNEGMLYVFNVPDRYPFWTKDMRYPIDMIFITRDRQISDLIENVPPCTGSCPMYRPTQPVTYVIEVNGGYVSNNNIDLGDGVVFIY